MDNQPLQCGARVVSAQGANPWASPQEVPKAGGATEDTVGQERKEAGRGRIASRSRTSSRTGSAARRSYTSSLLGRWEERFRNRLRKTRRASRRDRLKRQTGRAGTAPWRRGSTGRLSSFPCLRDRPGGGRARAASRLAEGRTDGGRDWTACGIAMF